MERGFSAFLDEFTPQQLQTLDDCLAMPSWTSFGDNSSEFTCHGPDTGRATPPVSFALRNHVLDTQYKDGSCVPLAALQSSASLSTESESCDEDGATAAGGKSRARSSQPEQAGSSSSKLSHSSGGMASSSKDKSTGSKRSRADSESICGVLCPFDVIKNYGMSGTMSLQQLNAKIRAVSGRRL